MTAIVPFSGDNSGGKLTPRVELDFSLAGVQLSLDGRRYEVKLPKGDEFAVDTDGDGRNNRLDAAPFDKSR